MQKCGFQIVFLYEFSKAISKEQKPDRYKIEIDKPFNREKLFASIENFCFELYKTIFSNIYYIYFEMQFYAAI